MTLEAGVLRILAQWMGDTVIALRCEVTMPDAFWHAGGR